MRSEGAEGKSGLRIIAFNVEPAAYQLVAEWAARHGHDLTLLVTTPGPPPRLYTGYRDIVALAPPKQEILITTRLRRAVPMLAALEPDLIVSFTFPYRIPAEIRSLPRYGAVNLHPSPLPRYRGPNPARMIYEGESTLGATLHRLEEGFDTGAILSCHERPMPAEPTAERILTAWREVMVAAVEEGTERAIAGEPGEPQDDALASYAAPFTEEERWLDWRWPIETLQRRAVALNLVVPQAMATIAGKRYAVKEVRPLPEVPPVGPPGKLLDQTNGLFTVSAADGVVHVVAAPDPSKENG